MNKEKINKKFTAIVRVHETEDNRSFHIKCEPTQKAVVAAVEQALLQDMIDDGLSQKGDSTEAVIDRGYDLNSVIVGWVDNVFDSLDSGWTDTSSEPNIPVVVLQVKGGLINCINATSRVRVVILDGDTEGGDPDEIKVVNGEDVYVVDYNGMYDTEPGYDGICPEFVNDVIRQIEG